jgi:hypothetical protein
MRFEVGERKAWEAMTDAIFAFGIFLKVKERTKNIELKETRRKRLLRSSLALELEKMEINIFCILIK